MGSFEEILNPGRKLASRWPAGVVELLTGYNPGSFCPDARATPSSNLRSKLDDPLEFDFHLEED